VDPLSRTGAPDFAAARFNYANLLFNLSRFQDSLSQLDLLLERDGSNALSCN